MYDSENRQCVLCGQTAHFISDEGTGIMGVKASYLKMPAVSKGDPICGRHGIPVRDVNKMGQADLELLRREERENAPNR